MKESEHISKTIKELEILTDCLVHIEAKVLQCIRLAIEASEGEGEEYKNEVIGQIIVLLGGKPNEKGKMENIDG